MEIKEIPKEILKPQRLVISRNSSVVIISIHNLVVVKDTYWVDLHHNYLTQKK